MAKDDMVYAGGAMLFLAIATLVFFVTVKADWCTPPPCEDMPGNYTENLTEEEVIECVQENPCGISFFRTTWFFVIAFFVLIGIGLFVEGKGGFYGTSDKKTENSELDEDLFEPSAVDSD